jgi:hypothetical protein
MRKYLAAAICLLASLTAIAGDKKVDDSIAWGQIDHGVRFGLALGRTAPDPQLRLIFQNVDRPQCLIPLGSESAKGPVYDVEFQITSPDGKTFPLFNFNGPPGIQPAAKPIVIEIPKGRRHEIDLSENKLIWLDNGKSRPLTDMLAQHYSVRARVDTSGDARWTRTLSQWMGKVSTGDLKQ